MVDIKINIVSMGKVQLPFLQEIRKELRKMFGVPVDILEQMEIPKTAYNRFRNQYMADQILSFLEKNAQPIVLGITDADIYTGGLNFLFGLAKKDKATVVSLARLNPSFHKELKNDELFLERVVKESIHEIGHVLGLSHCKERGCVMNFSNNTRDVDNKGKEFCHMCTIQLR